MSNISDMLDMTKGSLHMFIGPMFAGKTSKLIEIKNFYKNTTMKTTVIDYIDDIQKSAISGWSVNGELYNYTNISDLHTSVLTNHNNIQIIDCLQIYKLDQLIKFINELGDVLLINESQFFEDSYHFVNTVIHPPYNKKVFMFGLDGDFKANLFGNWMLLIPHCDTIEKLKSSICEHCKKQHAIYSHRTINSEEQIIIGGKETYIPLCRKCYHMKTIK